MGFSLDSCMNCPAIISNCDLTLKSMLNCFIVSSKTGYSCSRVPWSKVGNKWCKAWSPKLVNTKKWFPLISVRSITASSWLIPQSLSSSGLQSGFICHFFLLAASAQPNLILAWECLHRGRFQDGGEQH